MSKTVQYYPCHLLESIEAELDDKADDILERPDPRHSVAPRLSVIVRGEGPEDQIAACLHALGRSLAKAQCEAEVFILAEQPGANRLAQRMAGRVEERILSPGDPAAKGVNEAANRARGAWLLIMDGAPIPLSGAIETALSLWSRSPGTATLTGRIVLSDGTLVSAGGTIWSDDRPSPRGAGERANDPAYMFQCDTDFSTSQFLITDRETYLHHEGFDESLPSLETATADYCQRLTTNGQRHIYCPSIVIVDRSAHDPVYAEERSRALEAHKEFATSQAAAGKARSRDTGKPHILLMDDIVPHDLMGSGFPRARQLLECLSECDVEVTFRPMRDPSESWRSIRAVVPDTIAVMHPGNGSLKRTLADHAERYDAIWVSRPHNMRKLLNNLPPEDRDGVRPFIIYDAEALYSEREIVKRRLQGSPVPKEEAKTMIEDELSLIGKAKHILAVSDADRETLSGQGNAKVSTLGHFLKPRESKPGFDQRRGIVFMGALHAEGTPNADSLHWFCRDVLPHIRQSLGQDIRLQVIGKNKIPSLEALDGKDLDLLGPIDDPTPIFDAARVFVAPTRFAAGIPLKVHHAVSYGIPVVTTGLLTRQLGWASGVELLADDDPHRFAQHVIALHSEPTLWTQIRDNAERQLRTDCSKQRFYEAVESILTDLRVHMARKTGDDEQP